MWRYVVLAVLIIALYTVFFSGTINPPKTVFLKKWDTIQTFLQPLSWSQRMRMKWYLMKNSVDTKKIQTGTYAFSGAYTPQKYADAIVAWPSQEYIRYTMLEGRSLYDIDADMKNKWLIQAWAFLQKAQDPSVIQQLATKYPYITTIFKTHTEDTLEWLLYPDTYFLSTNGDAIDQLLQASLKRFNEKIYSLWEQQGSSFLQNISSSYSASIPQVKDIYDAIILASVIEKEERAASAKPTIAGIFLNRLSQWIQLGADITLCYGLEEPYETCTPSVIVQWINDTKNIYNTRIQKWLPPTPISSVTATTFDALLHFKKTPYLFYLHDNKGQIYYAETNAQHEENKSKYLR